MYSLGELADRLDLQFSGDATRTITGMATWPRRPLRPELSLLERKYLPQLRATRAARSFSLPNMRNSAR